MPGFAAKAAASRRNRGEARRYKEFAQRLRAGTAKAEHPERLR